MDEIQFILLIFSGITALATTIYACIMLQQAEPLISVSIEPDRFDNLSMNLIIENIGNGIAYDVRFKSIPDFHMFGDRYLSQIGLFKNGLPFFAPHQKLILFLTWMPEDYENKINNPFDIEIKYQNWCKLPTTKLHHIDLFLFGEHPLTENPLSIIARNVEGINKKLK